MISEPDPQKLEEFRAPESLPASSGELDFDAKLRRNSIPSFGGSASSFDGFAIEREVKAIEAEEIQVK